MVLKAACYEILTITVSPDEVKAQVAHESHQDAVASGAVKEAGRRVEKLSYDKGGKIGHPKVTLHDPSINSANCICVCLVQPVRWVSLEEAAASAGVKICRQVTEDSCGESLSGPFSADTAVHIGLLGLSTPCVNAFNF